MGTGRVRQAVILCAGRGTRLGELTARTPKPMLPVPVTARGPSGRPLGRAEQPLLERTVRNLKRAGIEELILVVGHLAGCIEDHFRDWPGVRFAVQPEPQGTADALARTLQDLAPRFLLTYGDLWLAADNYPRILAAAASDRGNWIAVNRQPKPVGAVFLEQGRVRRVVEKPPGECGTRWNAPGLFVLTRAMAAFAVGVRPSARRERELAAALTLGIESGLRLRPIRLIGRHVDIGTPERYRALCARGDVEHSPRSSRSCQ